ncbi:MAG: nucleotide exchange factor GrpE [Acidobacteriia bacterium]|nr:nucleotide exchange factor GrpE [Terriglobia bacterium]
MAKGNGKPDLDLEHELPPGEDGGEVTPEAGAPESQAPISEAAAQQEELRKLRAERDALYDRLARQQADFENQRKRIVREQAEFKDYALADAVKELLPIVDSFDRAIKHAGPEDKDFRSGVELINRQLHDALAKLGVRQIPSEGEPFDPHLHQAVQMVDTDQAEDNHVLEELQRGYKLKDRLLRPAMVRVARNPKSKS